MIYWFQSKAEYVPYYRNSLLYLACIELSEIETEERILRAHDLSIAALLGGAISGLGGLVCLETSKASLHLFPRELSSIYECFLGSA